MSGDVRRGAVFNDTVEFVFHAFSPGLLETVLVRLVPAPQLCLFCLVHPQLDC